MLVATFCIKAIVGHLEKVDFEPKKFLTLAPNVGHMGKNAQNGLFTLRGKKRCAPLDGFWMCFQVEITSFDNISKIWGVEMDLKRYIAFFRF